RIQKGRVQLFTRNENDWTNRLTALTASLTAAKLPEGWYDGEIVILDENGLPDFQALQNAFDKSATQNMVYFLFDLPFCDGVDLRTTPLVVRREKLQQLLLNIEGDAIRFSDAFDATGKDIVTSACKLGLEGVVGKKKSSYYVSRRSTDWIKLKCSLRQEFVI